MYVDQNQVNMIKHVSLHLVYSMHLPYNDYIPESPPTSIFLRFFASKITTVSLPDVGTYLRDRQISPNRSCYKADRTNILIFNHLRYFAKQLNNQSCNIQSGYKHSSNIVVIISCALDKNDLSLKSLFFFGKKVIEIKIRHKCHYINNWANRLCKQGAKFFKKLLK